MGNRGLKNSCKVFEKDQLILPWSLELLGLVSAEMGKAELSALLRQCVSALSNRLSSESICDPLYGDVTTHREAWHLGVPPHTWADLDSPHPPPEDPKNKIHVPTSILRKRSNQTGSSPELSHGRKSDRRVHFRDPEFTVYTYCAPGCPYLTFLTGLVLLLSILVVVLFCASWQQSQRPCEVLQAVVGKVVWGSWLWLTMQ
ncbi:hypothetical protein SKAU_G00276850 [Synaphobranchus kaupii]|uniref:Uncharacterized protein n=1 Tax=Synaphobranchus kaupii TaxID=118154 RepID=A0A9Q1IR59_SYNKA|nr:hypothetical protein SKAU_G00276850 [Synaphobranchus kaupii]